jgi:hypothetical protein
VIVELLSCSDIPVKEAGPMEILIPVPAQREETHIAQTKLTSIKGAKVAFVDDYYDAAFTEELEAELSRTYGALVQRLVKPWGSAPSPAARVEEAAASAGAHKGRAQ